MIWRWRLLSLEPFGVVLAQVRSAWPFAGWHVRRVSQALSENGEWHARAVAVLEEMSGKPLRVYPSGLHWMSEPPPEAVKALEKEYEDVDPAPA